MHARTPLKLGQCSGNFWPHWRGDFRTLRNNAFITDRADSKFVAFNDAPFLSIRIQKRNAYIAIVIQGERANYLTVLNLFTNLVGQQKTQ
jgi:hypothetical protein